MNKLPPGSWRLYTLVLDGVPRTPPSVPVITRVPWDDGARTISGFVATDNEAKAWWKTVRAANRATSIARLKYEQAIRQGLDASALHEQWQAAYQTLGDARMGWHCTWPIRSP